LVNDALRRSHGADHQDEGAHALQPGRPAEEQPPDNDRQPAGGPAEYRGATGLGHDEGDDEEAQPLQRHGDDPGPQPERSSGGPFAALGVCHIGPPLPMSGITGNQIGSRQRRIRAATARNAAAATSPIQSPGLPRNPNGSSWPSRMARPFSPALTLNASCMAPIRRYLSREPKYEVWKAILSTTPIPSDGSTA